MQCFIHIRFTDRDSVKLWFDGTAAMDEVANKLREAKHTDVVRIPRDRSGEVCVCMWNVTNWEVGYDR